MALYKKRVKADELNKSGGYKNEVLFAPRDSFLVIAKPTVTTNLGNRLEIITDHTFTSPAGFFKWRCADDSVKLTGESDEFKNMIWKGTYAILGDSSSTQEQIQNQLDDDIIYLIKDADCLNAEDYIQLGDECVSPKSKVTFDSADTSTGEKRYTVEITVKAKKYWYSGTVTEATP